MTNNIDFSFHVPFCHVPFRSKTYAPVALASPSHFFHSPHQAVPAMVAGMRANSYPAAAGPVPVLPLPVGALLTH
jgi:hypothetical protein